MGHAFLFQQTGKLLTKTLIAEKNNTSVPLFPDTLEIVDKKGNPVLETGNTLKGERKEILFLFLGPGPRSLQVDGSFAEGVPQVGRKNFLRGEEEFFPGPEFMKPIIEILNGVFPIVPDFVCIINDEQGVLEIMEKRNKGVLLHEAQIGKKRKLFSPFQFRNGFSEITPVGGGGLSKGRFDPVLQEGGTSRIFTQRWNPDVLNLPQRALTGRYKEPDGFDRLATQFQATGVFLPGRIDVHNTAAPGVFPMGADEIFAGISKGSQAFEEFVAIKPASGFQRKEGVFERLWSGKRLEKSKKIGDQKGGIPPKKGMKETHPRGYDFKGRRNILVRILRESGQGPCPGMLQTGSGFFRTGIRQDMEKNTALILEIGKGSRRGTNKYNRAPDVS
jgi:hypothetical protein